VIPLQSRVCAEVNAEEKKICRPKVCTKVHTRLKNIGLDTGDQRVLLTTVIPSASPGHPPRHTDGTRRVGKPLSDCH
jgi:hypothetical protein